MAIRYFAAVAVLWAVVVGHPAAVWPHGVGSREMDPGAARAMAFLYADGEPMAFARVQVTAPGEDGLFQSAHADARGCFAFVPTGPGRWTVVASDGQGHRAVRDVLVTLADNSDTVGRMTVSAVQGASGPGWRDVVLGISLLANLALFAALRRRSGWKKTPRT